MEHAQPHLLSHGYTRYVATVNGFGTRFLTHPRSD
jgi:hypothetical protein